MTQLKVLGLFVRLSPAAPGCPASSVCPLWHLPSAGEPRFWAAKQVELRDRCAQVLPELCLHSPLACTEPLV